MAPAGQRAQAGIARRYGASAGVALVAALGPAAADHDIAYFPSFYPQEIRIEPLDPVVAAKQFSHPRDPLHAYVGAAPRFTGDAPNHVKSAVSFGAFILASVNPHSPRLRSPSERCGALAAAGEALIAHPDVVRHGSAITPFHADYLAHFGTQSGGRHAGAPYPLTFRADASASRLLSADTRVGTVAWDVGLDEIPVSELARRAGANLGMWPPPPWMKDGWFQAYHLLRAAITDETRAQEADALYARRVEGAYGRDVERINIERDLLRVLTSGCERAVIGYRLRREFYNDDFSAGVENITVDSQNGLNGPMFVRTIKLKDFLWNGWLRLGSPAPAAAAWNPLAGFTDPAGRLIWTTVADDSFLPIPFNSRWAPNRVELRPDDAAASRQSVRIPADAVLPEVGTGRLMPVGSGKGAMSKLTYRVLTSPFHDGTESEAVDLLYPYVLAFRWGGSDPASPSFDPEIAAVTRYMRERLKGIRVIGTDQRSVSVSEQTVIHKLLLVEVYLDTPSDDEGAAALAPPWSPVPWHLLALMEAAAERGLFALSGTQAQRRGLPWLELVRDPAQRRILRELIKEFAAAGYRPASVADLVSPEVARARWQALDAFVEANGHLLVTNGPYRLRSWSSEGYVFDVVRDFTYPVGLGTFNPYAHPPRAVITDIERREDRVLVSVDAEMDIREQRSRRTVRVPLKPDTLRDTFAIKPLSQYIIIGADGRVVAAGTGRREADGRFAIALHPHLRTGAHTLFTAIFLDGNTVSPAIGRIEIGRE
jgi:hypothetical protein